MQCPKCGKLMQGRYCIGYGGSCDYVETPMKALIFGVGGQDGSYLADSLLARGWQVYGTVRRNSNGNPRVPTGVQVLRCDLTDSSSIAAVLVTSQPDVVFNEADQDNVDWSIATPRLSIDVTYAGALSVIEYCHRMGVALFQPISATIFGSQEYPDVTSPLQPASPYAIAKAAVLLACRHYRTLGAHICCPIMFNHDSPRRGSEYLLHRICSGKRIKLSDPGYYVDIGFAGDYMELACDLHKHNVDVIVGTGIAYTVEQLAYMVNADVEWVDAPPRIGHAGRGMYARTSGLKDLGLEPPVSDMRKLMGMLSVRT